MATTKNTTTQPPLNDGDSFKTQEELDAFFDMVGSNRTGMADKAKKFVDQFINSGTNHAGRIWECKDAKEVNSVAQALRNAIKGHDTLGVRTVSREVEKIYAVALYRK